MKKVALIVDVTNWAFYNIAINVKKHLKSKFKFTIIPLEEELNGNIIECFLRCKDYDLIHFFWRGYLNLIDEDFAKGYVKSKGMTLSDFKNKYIYNKIITTGIYDHLFLEKELFITKNILKYVDMYYTSSKKLYDIYSNLDIKKPYLTITDGINLERFYPINLDKLKNIDRKLIVGWVGNSAWGEKKQDVKGVNTILKPALKELIEEGIKIEPYFADKQERMIPHNKMNEYYSKIDLYICTSSIEGTPSPVLEAMACGIPVISTNVGIVPEAFGKFQQEYILKERNVKNLKDNLKKIYYNRDELTKLSEENLISIQKWSWEKKANEIEIFFKKAFDRYKNKYKEIKSWKD